MRLGGCLPGRQESVEQWIGQVKAIGYAATPFPLQPGAGGAEIREYLCAMKEHNILNAEVGAWSNPIAPDATERGAALRKNIAALELAEETGALCCVNIAGSLSAQWDGPHPDNLTEETFDLVVKTTRQIIDAVKPKRAKYSLETMPWAFPDSPEAYVRLIDAIERPEFGVHLDICNMVNSPRRFFYLDELIDESFRLLGKHILSLHLKDIQLSGKLTVHLDEVLPGQGGMNFGRIFRHAALLPPDTPMIIEHLHNLQDYTQAFSHLLGVIRAENLQSGAAPDIG